MADQWQFLVQKSAEKSQKLKEANKQQNFNTGIKDFDFWLSEVTPRVSPFPSPEEVQLFGIVDRSGHVRALSAPPLADISTIRRELCAV